VKDVVVIGLGNPLMGDEGVGAKLVARLAERADDFPGVDFLDVGTSAMRVVHAVAGRRKAIFVDCAFMDEKPGNARRFTRAEVRSIKKLPGFSLHETDLLSALDLSARLGECPGEIVIFGIEPENVSPSEDLSETLSSRMEEYEKLIVEELKD